MTNEVDPTVKYIGAVVVVVALILMCGGVVIGWLAR